MAIDAFIKFETPGNSSNNIGGESQDSQFPGATSNGSAGWSAISTVTFESENNANVVTAGGGSGAGKTTFKPFSIKKQVDNASPQLFLAMCSGDHYNKVTLVCRKTGGGTEAGKPYLQYTFAEVKVLTINTELDSEAEAPSETVTFSYAAMKIDYAKQLTTGKLSSFNTTQWSQTKNVPQLAA